MKLKKLITSLLLSILMTSAFAQESADTSLKSNSSNTENVPPMNEVDLSKHPIGFKIQDKMNSIAKIEVQGIIGKEKQTTGSGSLITEDGLLLTNYHVISSHFFNPQSNKIIVLFPNQSPLIAELKMVDIISDLALIKIDKVPANLKLIEINDKIPNPGDPIYSVGYPHGWSLTVLEGLFNNLISSKLAPQYLLSNALSPGMSGGPTLDAQGTLIAINVAATNKLSLVIPAERAKILLNDFNALSKRKEESYIENIQFIRKLAIENYKKTMSLIVEKISSSEKFQIGSFSLPIKNELFECWSNQNQNESINLEKIPKFNKENILIAHRLCKSKDSFFLNDNKDIGGIFMGSAYYQNKDYNEHLYKKFIQEKYSAIIVPQDRQKCFQENVTNKNKALRSINVCIRPMKETKQLLQVSFNNLYENNSEYLFLNFEFNGISRENILKIINYIKNL